jgi:hypothetical protein
LYPLEAGIAALTGPTLAEEEETDEEEVEFDVQPPMLRYVATRDHQFVSLFVAELAQMNLLKGLTSVDRMTTDALCRWARQLDADVMLPSLLSLGVEAKIIPDPVETLQEQFLKLRANSRSQK